MTSTPTRSGMPGHFGIRITDADKDKLVGELDADDRHLNNSGHVHGGALAAFADDLGGRLAGLNVPPGFRTTTIESKTNIFRACGRSSTSSSPTSLSLSASVMRMPKCSGIPEWAGVEVIAEHQFAARAADDLTAS